MTRRLFSSGLIAIAFLVSACGVSQSPAPTLTGPSTFATSLSVTATPDTINQDGASKSTIVVSAYGPTGQPLVGASIRVDMAVAGVLQDFGTLSARNVVTGSDGRATAIYTAPPAPPPAAAGAVATVSIQASVVGTNTQTSQFAGPSSADIRLTPVGVILPPADAPIPNFTVSPTPISQNVPVIFDASSSEPGTNATRIVSYQWTFGDGTAGSGVAGTHTYSAPGTFTVTLTVTNDRSLSASTTKTIAVGVSAEPKAVFVVSKSDLVIGETAFFNGDASRATPGRSIVQWSWDFGDGATAAGSNLFSTQHAYDKSGTYTVTLSIRDDADQRGTTSTQVKVGSGNPQPTFFALPSTPKVGDFVTFDASQTVAFGGATIQSYEWSFDGGTPSSSTNGPTVSGVQFNAASPTGGFTITLVVTDSLNRKGQFSLQLTVSP